MASHGSVEAPITREQLRPLQVRRNLPGLARILTQLVAFLVAGAATSYLASRGHPAWIATVVAMGVVLATLFPAQHETGHRTAFRTTFLNEWVLWICAVAMLQAPAFFREFHWAHHRHTQDREQDPEIAGAPQFLAPWPSNPLTYLLVASGQALWLGKLMFTLLGAILPTAASWERIFPFTRAERRKRIAWESRAVLAIWLCGIAVGFTVVPAFAKLLLAWPIAHIFLGLYLMPEHTGLPDTGSQLQRTRTMISNGIVRWWMWNMPYHAEHHAHPAVPFHALPQLHQRLAPHLEHLCPGYAAFHIEALGHAFGRRP